MKKEKTLRKNLNFVNNLIFNLFLFLFNLALVLLNLLSLWIDTENNARIGLLALSLYGHFSYIQQISWYVPSNGDSLPDISKFTV